MAETLENPSAQDMEVEAPQADDASTENGSGGSKRPREEAAEEPEKEDENGDAAKKQKVEKSVEEKRLEKSEESEAVDGDMKEDDSGPVNLGPKKFGSSVEMYDYFYKLLHSWTPNININKYEHLTLLELLKKGHLEPEKKIGEGVRAFQVRYHPQFKSRCFFLIREDESVDDFSFRKCVDHILPLPESMQIKHDVNKALAGGGKGGGGGGGGGGGRGGGRGHGRGRGRGRGGKSRN